MERIATWRLATSGYATEPTMVALRSAAPGHTLWISWTERAASDATEAIWARRLDVERNGAEIVARAPLRLSECHSASWPSLAAQGSELAVCWTETDGEGTWRVVSWRPDSGTKVLASVSAVLRRPAAILSTSRMLLVAVEVWDRQRDQYRIELIADNGSEVNTTTLATSSNLLCRPALVERGDRSVLVAWEQLGVGEVVLQGAVVAGPRLERTWSGTLIDNGAFNQAPSLSAMGHDGAWMAYATDFRPDASSDLSRAVHLAALTFDAEGQLAVRETQIPGVDLEANGEDQSLEFPMVGADEDSVWITARASHNYRLARLVVEDRFWTETFELGPVLWGCRGIRLSTVPLDVGTVAVVAHDRKGIEVSIVADDSQPTTPEHGAWAAPTAAGEPHRSPEPHERPTWDGGNDGGPPLRAYMGDIHFHSALSDGLGTVEEAYLRCRDRYQLDFACLTDHDSFIGRRLTASAWEHLMDVADAFDRPAEGFTTLIGVEYTGQRFPGPGHKCVYLPDRGELVCRADGLEESPALLGKVRELGGIAIPHHVGWLGGDYEHHDAEVQPCWEICSAHGQYEAEMDEPHAPKLGHRLGLPEHREALRQHFIRRRLEAGQVFGFVGGSDGHGLLWHHGISKSRDSHQTALTGVWTAALGRRAVFDAIVARRTWATSGARMVLHSAMAGVPMGGVLEASPGADPSVTLGCWAGGPIEQVEVFVSSASGTVRVADLPDAVGRERWSGELKLSLGPLASGHAALYVRMTRTDGQLAWASPIFW